jgi:hypothetical protein
MDKVLLGQTLAELVSDLESICAGFTWVYDVGDHPRDIVRKTYKAYAGEIIRHHARRMQAALSLIGPEGSAAWQALVTPETVDIRPF